jgi:hypothetical protein
MRGRLVQMLVRTSNVAVTVQVLKSHRVREVRVRIVDGLAHDKPRKLTSPRAGRKGGCRRGPPGHVSTLPPPFSPDFTFKLPELPPLILFCLFHLVLLVKFTINHLY